MEIRALAVNKEKAKQVPAPKNQPGFFQAVTLYGPSDTEVGVFIKKHRDELCKMSGVHLLIVLPKDVLDGNSSWMSDVFDVPDAQSRYPGLKRSQLPCIFVEDRNNLSAVIRLEHVDIDMMKIMRAVVDACEEASNIMEFQAAYSTWLAQEKAGSTVKVELVGEAAKDLGTIADTTMDVIEGATMTSKAQGWFAAICGLILILVVLGLTFWEAEPTQFQQDIIRIVLALAAAGFAVTFSGFLQIKMGKLVKAGGALAVFAIVYFYNPAGRSAEDATAVDPPAPAAETTTGSDG